MKISRLTLAMGEIEDDLILAEAEYSTRRREYRTRFWKYGMMAACLCVVICAGCILGFHRFGKQETHDSCGPYAERTHGDVTYPVEQFLVEDSDELVPLYAYTVPLPQDLYDHISEHYRNIGYVYPRALYVARHSVKEQSDYWVPVLVNGWVTDIIMTGYDTNGEPYMSYFTVTPGSTVPYADELNALAERTSPEHPLFIISEIAVTYYVIDGVAYVSEEIAQRFPSFVYEELIGDFVLPNEKASVENIQ